MVQSPPSSPSPLPNELLRPRPQSKLAIFWKNVIGWLLNNWLLFALGLSIGVAAAYPPLGTKGGIFRSEYSVHYGATGIIFLLSGMSLKTAVLGRTLLQWKTHVTTQILSLGVYPVIGFGVGRILIALGYNQVLAHGLITTMSTPTTIASNVTMTQKAGGNEPAALTNAVLGNIIGVFLSPVLIIAYTGGPSTSSASGVNYGSIFLDLAYTVIIPLIIGQLFRFLLSNQVEWLQAHIKFGLICNICLLLLVWAAFCDTFASGATSQIAGADMLVIIILDWVFFLGFSAVSFGVARIPFLRFTREDTVAIVMCASTKTASLGVPLIQVIFRNDPRESILTVPLLIYHAVQLLTGAVFVTLFQSWLRRQTVPDDEDVTITSLEKTDAIPPQSGGNVEYARQSIENEKTDPTKNEIDLGEPSPLGIDSKRGFQTRK